MDSPKKYLYIFAGVLAFCAIALVVYVSFFSKKSVNEAEDVSGGLSVSDEQRNREGQSGGLGADTGSGDDFTPGSTGDEYEQTFQWSYANKTYSVTQKFSKKAYEYYVQQPSEYLYLNQIPGAKENQYYGTFLVKKDEEKNLTTDLLGAIVAQGKQNNLSENQMVELVVTFAQNIPFDTQKAEDISTGGSFARMKYPYETLYEKKGVSFEKAYVAYMLLRELGYGAAVFAYDDGNHVGAGVLCPIAVSNYNSGYCFVEPTNPSIYIGTIPDLESYSGKAIAQGSGRVGSIKLAKPGIFQRSQGKEYTGLSNILLSGSGSGTGGKLTEADRLKAQVAQQQEKVRELQSKINEKRKDISFDDNDLPDECGSNVDDLERVLTAAMEDALNGIEDSLPLTEEEMIELIESGDGDVEECLEEINDYNDNFDDFREYYDELSEEAQKLVDLQIAYMKAKSAK